MAKYKIAVIPGDGIGPEVTNATRTVLDAVAARFRHEFVYEELLAGGIAIDATGEPLPVATVASCRNSDAVMLGAVGGPQWDTLPGECRPERALLGLRSALGLYANLRPAVLHPALASACPLHPSIAARGIDILFVRELTGGLYFGARGRRDGANGPEAFDTESYSVMEVERIARMAFELAGSRRKHLTSVDKANVLESSRLWRETVLRIAAEFPDVRLDHLYVDNASMQLIRQPDSFDVLVTSNMFGDILSDEAAMITGSIGMLPSASLGRPGTPGLYEPIHGSAPDIAGQNKANPLAAILSAAMLLRLSLRLPVEAAAIEQAVARVLAAGYRTADIFEKDKAGAAGKPVGTEAMSLQVAAAVKEG
ncbi:MAG TPA: 3-isopropylmalate dehydrogenase [Clostridiales bacterium]|nr:3-isopropylmalate dehydrogenase [Clostridiales bacterium]